MTIGMSANAESATLYDLAALLHAEGSGSECPAHTVAARCRAAFQEEALAADAVSAVYQVVFSPRVAIRSGASMDAKVCGARSHGTFVAVSETRGGWVRLVKADVEHERFMLADPAGTSVANLGPLLQPIVQEAPTTQVTLEPTGHGPLDLISPTRRLPVAELPDRVRGGIDGGPSWRLFLSARCSQLAAPSAPMQAVAHLASPRIIMHHLVPGDDVAIDAVEHAAKSAAADAHAMSSTALDHAADAAGTHVERALAHAFVALCREARALLLSPDRHGHWPSSTELSSLARGAVAKGTTGDHLSSRSDPWRATWAVRCLLVRFPLAE